MWDSVCHRSGEPTCPKGEHNPLPPVWGAWHLSRVRGLTRPRSSFMWGSAPSLPLRLPCTHSTAPGIHQATLPSLCNPQEMALACDLPDQAAFHPADCVGPGTNPQPPTSIQGAWQFCNWECEHVVQPGYCTGPGTQLILCLSHHSGTCQLSATPCGICLVSLPRPR